MGMEDVVAAAFYAIINMMIPIAFGFLLRKLDVLTRDNRKVLSSMNYYVLAPLYSLIFVMQAIDRKRITEFGLVLFSSLSSVAIGFLVVLFIMFILRADIRYRYSLTFAIVYANAIVMPQMIADSTCDKGGKYSDTPQCKQALVKPYAALPLVYLNIFYWITVLPVLQNEQRITLETKKIFAIVLNYYDSIDHFISDTNLTGLRIRDFDEASLKQKREAAAGPPQSNRDQSRPGVSGADPGAQSTSIRLPMNEDLNRSQSREPSADVLLLEPIALTAEKFIAEYYDRSITTGDYEQILRAFENVESHLNTKPEFVKSRKIIDEYVLQPAGLLKSRSSEKVFSWKFVKERILMSPPAMCSLLGVVLGFIFPFKEWVFDVNNKPLPTFLATLSTLGAMMSPISMFLLGASIAEGARIQAAAFLRWKHIIISIVVRFIILPLVGLLWIFVFLRDIDQNSFEKNPVLTLICYIYWVLPNGLILMVTFAVADHFTLEFGILSIYLNIAAVPMMVLFLILYFALYEAY